MAARRSNQRIHGNVCLPPKYPGSLAAVRLDWRQYKQSSTG